MIKMKKFLASLIFILTIALSAYAECDNTGQNGYHPTNIDLKLGKIENGNGTPHRKQFYVYIEAYYIPQNNSIEITYFGEAEGEAYLYNGDNLIDYSSSINTTFTLPSQNGLYTIEIVTDSWIAQGYLQIQ